MAVIACLFFLVPAWRALIRGCFVQICICFKAQGERRCSATCPASVPNYAVLPSGLGKGCFSTTLWSGVNSGRTRRVPFLLSSETEAMDLGWFFWVTRKKNKTRTWWDTSVALPPFQNYQALGARDDRVEEWFRLTMCSRVVFPGAGVKNAPSKRAASS